MYWPCNGGHRRGNRALENDAWNGASEHSNGRTAVVGTVSDLPPFVSADALLHDANTGVLEQIQRERDIFVAERHSGRRAYADVRATEDLCGHAFSGAAQRFELLHHHAERRIAE